MAFAPNDPRGGSSSGESYAESVLGNRETLSERVGSDPLEWVDVVAKEVLTKMGMWAADQGYSTAIAGQIYNRNADRLFQDLQHHFFTTDLGGPGSGNKGYYTGTQGGLQSMVNWAVNWMSGKMGADLSTVQVSRGGGGGGGGGRRGLTAEEIRNQYDVDALARQIDELNQTLVFEKHKNAKGLARKYVDAIVAGKGEKNIDFENFVRTNIEGSNRFKAIYRSKPEGMQAEQYMQPYFQAALQRLRPDDADDVAIGGAQFAASPEAFRARVERQQRVEGQAPFIQGLEGRLQELNGILKG